MRIELSQFSLLKIVIACLSIGFALLLILLMPQVQAAQEVGEKLITIHDRGVEKSVISEQDTLRKVLAEADIRLDTNDIVEPGLDDKLVSNNYQVNIYRARPVIIIDGPVKQLVMSAHQTPKQIARHAGIALRDEDEATLGLTDNMIRDGASVKMVVDRAYAVRLSLYGATSTVYTQAKTVADFIEEKGITLGPNDDMSVEKDTVITKKMKLSIWRNGKQTVTKEEKVPFDVKQIQDTDRPASYKEVSTPGKPGMKMVTYEIVMRNGVEVSRKVIQTVVTKNPITQVERVGAKFNYTGGPLSEAQINALGQCETGMNPTTNTGNGFYGAFQFMPATWQTAAPAPYNSKMPHEAPLEAQKQAVQTLLSRSSIYSQFPGCAKKMSSQGIL